MPNPDIRWSTPSDGHTFPIYGGAPSDMERLGDYAVERDTATIRFAGDVWQLEAGKGPRMTATTSPETGSQVFTAVGDAATFGRSKNVVCTIDRYRVLLHQESRKEFVLLDATDAGGEGQAPIDLESAPKIGQFTSEQGGLKNLHVEFEGAGQKLPLDAQVFLSWVARHAMETRAVSGAWGLTISMIILIPVVLLYILGYL